MTRSCNLDAAPHSLWSRDTGGLRGGGHKESNNHERHGLVEAIFDILASAVLVCAVAHHLWLCACALCPCVSKRNASALPIALTHFCTAWCTVPFPGIRGHFINLRSRTDRKRAMHASLARAGLAGAVTRCVLRRRACRWQVQM